MLARKYALTLSLVHRMSLITQTKALSQKPKVHLGTFAGLSFFDLSYFLVWPSASYFWRPCDESFASLVVGGMYVCFCCTTLHSQAYRLSDLTWYYCRRGFNNQICTSREYYHQCNIGLDWLLMCICYNNYPWSDSIDKRCTVTSITLESDPGTCWPEW